MVGSRVHGENGDLRDGFGLMGDGRRRLGHRVCVEVGCRKAEGCVSVADFAIVEVGDRNASSWSLVIFTVPVNGNIVRWIGRAMADRMDSEAIHASRSRLSPLARAVVS